jgi:hypothetical protein
MVRCSIDLSDVSRLLPAPFVSGDGAPIAWLEVESVAARVALYGPAAEMRALATAALAVAEQAEEFGRVADQLRVVTGAHVAG